jgi:ABC-2 type transport system ATP-binding protein
MHDYGDELVESFSHGMKQRLVMASALIHRPRVLIVDEPMVGLDPKGAKLVKRIFRELCQTGATVFMSTHTLEIAEEMCDRIGIINEGALIAVGTMKQLRETTGGAAQKLESIFFKLTGQEAADEALAALRV